MRDNACSPCDLAHPAGDDPLAFLAGSVTGCVIEGAIEGGRVSVDQLAEAQRQLAPSPGPVGSTRAATGEGERASPESDEERDQGDRHCRGGMRDL